MRLIPPASASGKGTSTNVPWANRFRPLLEPNHNVPSANRCPPRTSLLASPSATVPDSKPLGSYLVKPPSLAPNQTTPSLVLLMAIIVVPVKPSFGRKFTKLVPSKRDTPELVPIHNVPSSAKCG